MAWVWWEGKRRVQEEAWTSAGVAGWPGFLLLRWEGGGRGVGGGKDTGSLRGSLNKWKCQAGSCVDEAGVQGTPACPSVWALGSARLQAILSDGGSVVHL